MEEEKNLQQATENDENKAGCVGIAFSFLFPIVGTILYFTQKESVVNSSAYLVAAVVGIAIGFFMNLIASMAA